jgi:hypothetical protein
VIFAHTVDQEGHSSNTPFAELHVDSRHTKLCSELTPEDAASVNMQSVGDLLRSLGMPVFSVQLRTSMGTLVHVRWRTPLAFVVLTVDAAPGHTLTSTTRRIQCFQGCVSLWHKLSWALERHVAGRNSIQASSPPCVYDCPKTPRGARRLLFFHPSVKTLLTDGRKGLGFRMWRWKTGTPTGP